VLVGGSRIHIVGDRSYGRAIDEDGPLAVTLAADIRLAWLDATQDSIVSSAVGFSPPQT
jgi:hypothetical protein